MIDTIATIWVIAGAVVWLVMHGAGAFDRFTQGLRHPGGVLSVLTLSVVAGWPIWLGYYLASLKRRYRAGRLWGRER